MAHLSRRDLFALPVALPVAAVAAKVAPAPALLDAGRIIVGMDAGGLDDRFVLWVVTSTRDGMRSLPPGAFWHAGLQAWCHWPEPTEFTDDELAATLGLDTTKSCGGVESRHAGSATRVSAAAPTETSGTVTRVQVKGEAGVAPGPHDTSALPVVA